MSVIYTDGAPSDNNNEYYSLRSIGESLDTTDGLPKSMRAYFKFSGSFLKFGNRITRAYILPGIEMTPKSIFLHCKDNLKDAARVVAWRSLLVAVEGNFPSEVAAFNMWDMEEKDRSLLFMRLDQLQYVAVEKLTPEMETNFFEELARACDVTMPFLDSGVAFDIVRPCAENGSMMEVAVSAFVNHLDSRDEIKHLLGTASHDPLSVTNLKIETIHDGIRHGMVNPEFTNFSMPTGNNAVDALVYNDGYKNYLSRAAQLAMPIKNNPVQLRRFRPGMFAYNQKTKLYVNEHNLIRIYLFYCEKRANGTLVYSTPEVCEYFRNSPPPVFDQMMYPLLFLMSSYSTGHMMYPVLNLFCYSPVKKKLNPYVMFVGGLQAVISLLMQKLIGIRRTTTLFSSLTTDALTCILERVSDKDIINLSSASYQLRKMVSKAAVHPVDDYCDWASNDPISARVLRGLTPRAIFAMTSNRRVIFFGLEQFLLYKLIPDPHGRYVYTTANYVADRNLTHTKKGENTLALIPRKRVREYSENNLYTVKRRIIDVAGVEVLDVVRLPSEGADDEMRAIIGNPIVWDVPESIDDPDYIDPLMDFSYQSPVATDDHGDVVMRGIVGRATSCHPILD